MDSQAIRETALKHLPDLVNKHRRNLSIVAYDVQFVNWIVGQNIVSTYAVILVAGGAVLGSDNWLTYVQPLTGMKPDSVFRPIPPTISDLEDAVQESISRLTMMRLAQLRTEQQKANPDSTDPRVN